jgi:hypothetical protein
MTMLIEREPVFAHIPTSTQMTQAFNHYAENYSWKDSRKFQTNFLIKRNLLELANYISHIEETEISWVSGWICRMIDNNSKINPDCIKYLERYLEGLGRNVKDTVD